MCFYSASYNYKFNIYIWKHLQNFQFEIQMATWGFLIWHISWVNPSSNDSVSFVPALSGIGAINSFRAIFKYKSQSIPSLHFESALNEMESKKDTKEIFFLCFMTRISLIWKGNKNSSSASFVITIYAVYFILLNMKSFRFTNVRQWSESCVMIYLSVKINLNWLWISEVVCRLVHSGLRSVACSETKLWEMSCHENNCV